MKGALENLSLEVVLDRIIALPSDWHGAGSLRSEVLRATARHASGRAIHHSAETGTGKSTLLLSHLSAQHTVFTRDDSGDGDSLIRVRESPLLRRDRVCFVVGPTQQMLPRHEFQHPLGLALIDGPHGYPFPDLEYYYLYPQLAADGLLLLDDIDIPTIFRLFEFLREDAMFECLEVVHTTAIFRRTDARPIDPLADGWWLQGYNRRHYPVSDAALRLSPWDRFKRRVPTSLRRLVRRLISR